MLCLFLIIQFIESFCLTVYIKYELFYADEYVESIISSEKVFSPINPRIGLFNNEEQYTYQFDVIKQNLDNPLCIQLVNLKGSGYLAFKSAYINEYDIKILNYENYYYCNNCNINTKQKFQTTNTTYYGSSIIYIIFL